MKKLRIYVDTSVVGGCFDDEFQEESWALIGLAKSGKICLLVSQILIDELKQAPEEVQDVLQDVPVEHLETIRFSEEARDLRDAYLAARVVGKEHEADAYHVALATVAHADIIVSWNFKHIVHFEKIRGFNAVNLLEGYVPIEICCPKVVI